jgi:hypothetical protein
MRLRRLLAALVVAAALWVVPAGGVAIAQETTDGKPQEATAGVKESLPRSIVTEPPVERDSSGRARVKFERGTKVFVGNKTTGRIVVTGWDRDYIEATATSENGVEYVWVGAINDATGARILLKADYANAVDREARRVSALEQRHQEIDRRRLELDDRQRETEEQQRDAEERLRKAQAQQSAPPDAKRTARESSPPAAAVSTPPPAAGSPGVAAKAPSGALISPPAGAGVKLRGPGKIPSNSSEIDFQIQLQHQINNKFNTNIQFPPGLDRQYGDIDIEVKVPRSAEIDLIKVIRSEVEITGVETGVTVHGDRSTIKVSHVGSAEVRTRSGRVEADNVRGLVDIITSSGEINIRQAGGDVRALSLSGDVVINCAGGRVTVSNTNGAITLTGIGGDVDATTTDSEIRFTGAIREEGRYHLKSMSGPVEMSVSDDAPGFTALLSSYRGGVKTDFQLQFKEAWSHEPRNTSGNRLVGRYGNGQAQITLDSFDGGIKLGKLTRTEIKDCR